MHKRRDYSSYLFTGLLVTLPVATSFIISKFTDRNYADGNKSSLLELEDADLNRDGIISEEEAKVYFTNNEERNEMHNGLDFIIENNNHMMNYNIHFH